MSEGENSTPSDLGGLQVDEEFDFRDQLDWQIRGLLAIEYPSGINASATMRLREISSVAHQASCDWEVTRLGDCGHAVSQGERGKLPTAKRKVRIRGEDKSARRFLSSGGENRFELLFTAGVQNLQGAPLRFRQRNGDSSVVNWRLDL